MIKSLKEFYEKTTEKTREKWNLTFVKPGTQQAEKMIELWYNIRYDNIFRAYERPSSTKVKTALDCAQLVNDLKEELDGELIKQGIAGAGKDNYNWLAKIYSSKHKIYAYVYCTVGYNRVVYINELDDERRWPVNV